MEKYVPKIKENRRKRKEWINRKCEEQRRKKEEAWNKLRKWRDRVQEYVRERGEGSLRNLEQARRVCQDRERWKKKKKKSPVTERFFFLGQLFLGEKSNDYC